MTTPHIPASLQRRVRARAQDRCEYCHLSQAGQEATFHVDHITPRAQGGPTTLANLALACVSCSLRKGARADARDPASGAIVGVFHPRNDTWTEHFAVGDQQRIDGKTPIGRATVALLQMNRSLALAIRAEETARGRFP